MPPHQQPPRPRRLLALDAGERRVGVALSDELGLFAHPRPALALAGEGLLAAIDALVEDEGVAEIVVGLPLTLAGGESEQTRRARALAARLRARLTIPVREWDERLSTVQAARTVRGASARRSGELDSAAAALVLQAVLDARRTGARP